MLGEGNALGNKETKGLIGVCEGGELRYEQRIVDISRDLLGDMIELDAHWRRMAQSASFEIQYIVLFLILSWIKERHEAIACSLT